MAKRPMNTQSRLTLGAASVLGQATHRKREIAHWLRKEVGTAPGRLERQLPYGFASWTEKLRSAHEFRQTKHHRTFERPVARLANGSSGGSLACKTSS